MSTESTAETPGADSGESTATAADTGTSGGGEAGTTEAKPTVPNPGTTTVRGAARGDAGPRTTADTKTGVQAVKAGGEDKADRASTEATGSAGDEDWKVEDLPKGAQREIARLRKEAGDRRTEAKKATAGKAELEAKAADADRLQEALKAFTTALNGGEEEAKEVTPQELTAKLNEATKQHEATQQELRISRVELAVYRAAGKHGADPDALLDSRTFLAKVKALDPTAEDFGDEVVKAINAAMRANPKLKAAHTSAAATAPSGGQFSGGPASRTDSDLSVDDMRAHLRKNASRRSTAA